MLENLKPVTRLYPCRVRILMQEFDSKDKVIFQNALDDSNLWPARSLANQLKRVADIIISDTAITKHRKRLCSCKAE